MSTSCACNVRYSLATVVLFLALAVVASGCADGSRPTPGGPIDITPDAGATAATASPTTNGSPPPTTTGQPTTKPGQVADPRACDGTLSGAAVDEVDVPDGSSCTLLGVDVRGSIRVGSRATLEASQVSVDGNIQARGAAAVTVSATSVEGNIQLERGGTATIRSTSIDGDLQLQEMTGALVADENDIGGNLQAERNTGGLAITNNTIDGNLECERNTPPPTGGVNIVGGSREDQCASL